MKAVQIFTGLLCALVVLKVSSSMAQDELQQKLAMANPIDSGQSYWIEELTWIEIRDLIATGAHTVIVPTGGIEENGPFLATGKHNLILEASCPAIAKMLGNALCAPIVKFVPEGDIDPPTGAMRFPGSISLTDTTYRALLTDITASLRQAGFKNIVLIGDSGGNQRGMDAVAEALNETWSDGTTHVHYIREFYDPGWVATENYTAEVLGVEEQGHDGHHDDIWVTAMMMVTDPTLVRYQQRLKADLASINGVDISDLEATVELGRKMIEFRAGLTVDAIRAAVDSK
ncbi:MAG: creatininase family protein [Pseudomonadota bacterium]